jgi:phosphatidylinositol alpha 1,6-mannosyltransferase
MIPRVAFFTDSFHEANGVALTSREFAAFARTRFYPFFSVHTGPKTLHLKRGRFETFELGLSGTLLRLEHDLAFDLLFLRHRHAVARALESFKPDVIHITGPSWHTNVHEFAGRRLRALLDWMPDRGKHAVAQFAELRISLCACTDLPKPLWRRTRS